MLATILSHLNVIFFHIYSKIVAVFLTMALLYRCLLAYRLKKKGECPPVRPPQSIWWLRPCIKPQETSKDTINPAGVILF